MKIHVIHDLSNPHVINILKKEFNTITDTNIISNYHPDYSDTTGNLFYLLQSGRYTESKGKYWVMEENGEYLGSAGWNEYELDPDVALVLTRTYVSKKFRGQYLLATHLLLMMLQEASNYQKTWLTVNEHNDVLYQWFLRSAENKRPALFNNWPQIYKKFYPLGKKDIYYTQQYVMEYTKE